MNRIFGAVIKSTTASSRCGIYACSDAALGANQSNILGALAAKPLATTLLQRQQMRWFPAKVKYNLKGFGPNGKMLKICFCYSEHDLYAIPKTRSQEQYLYTKSRCLLREIKEKTKEEFETCDDLEFFNGTEWLPLTNEKDVASWKGGEKVLNIRVPSRWDEFIHEDDMKNSDYDDYDPRIIDGSYNMKDVIDTLILTCKLTDMTRSRVKPYHLQKSDKKEISTKQWIINEAEKDKLLRSILLREPGTLDHIVQCLHFDFRWKKLKDVDPKVDPSNVNQIQYGNISRSFMV
jgi:hypothetical protein